MVCEKIVQQQGKSTQYYNSMTGQK